MRVNFDNPELPAGMEVDVGGLLLVNGEGVDVSDEQKADFENRNGRSIEDAMSRVQFVKVGGKKLYEETEPNPVLDVVPSSDDAGEGE